MLLLISKFILCVWNGPIQRPQVPSYSGRGAGVRFLRQHPSTHQHHHTVGVFFIGSGHSLEQISYGHRWQRWVAGPEINHLWSHQVLHIHEQARGRGEAPSRYDLIDQSHKLLP